MGRWIESIQSKAQIIHAQMAAALDLAKSEGKSPESVSASYLSLLSSLYEEEFPFAKMLDDSDLVVRFNGPSVDVDQPAMTVISRVFTDIRDEVRHIAKAIAGLASEKNLRWPAELDPHLSGLAKGSLLVGIKVPDPSEGTAEGQLLLPDVSNEVFKSVRQAVQSLAIVPRHVQENTVDEEIRNEFPDPAIRDAVMVAASRLAPTGRRGIDSITFYGPEPAGREPKPLTRQSRTVLNHALSRPVKVRGAGSFEGSVREIDLDARRFEIRGIAKAMHGIRCAYDEKWDRLVKTILDARVKVSGSYETGNDQTPRLVQINEIELVSPPEEQRTLGLTTTSLTTTSKLEPPK